MRATRLVTAALVGGSAAFAFLPLAHAATSTLVLTPSTEAWYQPNPTCGSPAGCVEPGALPAQPPVQPPAQAPLSPYPAGTLHVALDAGQETARTYLSFALPLVDGALQQASLDVPLDTTQADGSITPESSHVLVCAFQGALQPAEGAVTAPPTASCAASAKAAYVATPTPHLHADLAGLREPLAQGAGLVLLPDAASAAQTDVWHVVLSSHSRTDSAKTPPATLRVVLTSGGRVEESAPPIALPTDTGTATPPPLGSVSAPGPGLGSVTAPPVAEPRPAAPLTALPQARTITVGYAYPVVWLLPLALLVLVPAVARALTRDLTP